MPQRKYTQFPQPAMPPSSSKVPQIWSKPFEILLPCRSSSFNRANSQPHLIISLTIPSHGARLNPYPASTFHRKKCFTSGRNLPSPLRRSTVHTNGIQLDRFKASLRNRRSSSLRTVSPPCPFNCL